MTTGADVPAPTDFAKVGTRPVARDMAGAKFRQRQRADFEPASLIGQ